MTLTRGRKIVLIVLAALLALVVLGTIGGSFAPFRSSGTGPPTPNVVTVR